MTFAWALVAERLVIALFLLAVMLVSSAASIWSHRRSTLRRIRGTRAASKAAYDFLALATLVAFVTLLWAKDRLQLGVWHPVVLLALLAFYLVANYAALPVARPRAGRG